MRNMSSSASSSPTTGGDTDDVSSYSSSNSNNSDPLLASLDSALRGSNSSSIPQQRVPRPTLPSQVSATSSMSSPRTADSSGRKYSAYSPAGRSQSRELQRHHLSPKARSPPYKSGDFVLSTFGALPGNSSWGESPRFSQQKAQDQVGPYQYPGAFKTAPLRHHHEAQPGKGFGVGTPQRPEPVITSPACTKYSPKEPEVYFPSSPKGAFGSAAPRHSPVQKTSNSEPIPLDALPSDFSEKGKFLSHRRVDVEGVGFNSRSPQRLEYKSDTPPPGSFNVDVPPPHYKQVEGFHRSSERVMSHQEELMKRSLTEPLKYHVPDFVEETLKNRNHHIPVEGEGFGVVSPQRPDVVSDVPPPGAYDAYDEIEPMYKATVGGFSRLKAPRFSPAKPDDRPNYDVLRGEIRIWKGRRTSRLTARSGVSTPSSPSTPRLSSLASPGAASEDVLSPASLQTPTGQESTPQ